MEQVAEEAEEKEDDGDCCGVYTAMLVNNRVDKVMYYIMYRYNQVEIQT